MTSARGQALVEYSCVLLVLVAALCLPLGDGDAVVVQLERAIQHFWQAWWASVLSMSVAT